jgi:hypothetical protein
LVAKSVVIQDITTQLLLNTSEQVVQITSDVNTSNLVVADTSLELIVEDLPEVVQLISSAAQGPQGIAGTDATILGRRNLEWVVGNPNVNQQIYLEGTPATHWCSVFVQGKLLPPSYYTLSGNLLTIRSQDVGTGFVVVVEYVIAS